MQNTEKARASRRACYHKRSDYYIKKTKERRRRKLAAWLRTLKEASSCNRCGEEHPACLQYHHINPNEKKFDIAQAPMLGYCKERILKEIAKCEIVCANCHAKEHYTGC